MIFFPTKTLIFREYLVIAFLCLLPIYLIYEMYTMIIRNKYPFEWHLRAQRYTKKQRKKYSDSFIKYKKFYIIGFVLGLLFNFYLIGLFRDEILSLGKVFRGEYEVFVCKVDGARPYNSKRAYEGIYCLKENYEMVYIEYRGPALEKNDIVKVKYFETLEIGEIIWYQRDGHVEYLYPE